MLQKKPSHLRRLCYACHFKVARLDSADRVQVSGCQAHKLDVRSVRVGHNQVIGGESLGDVLVDTDLEPVAMSFNTLVGQFKL